MKKQETNTNSKIHHHQRLEVKDSEGSLSLTSASVSLTVFTLAGEGFGKSADGNKLVLGLQCSLSKTLAEMKDRMTKDRRAEPKITMKLETAGTVSFRKRILPRLIMV